MERKEKIERIITLGEELCEICDRVRNELLLGEEDPLEASVVGVTMVAAGQAYLDFMNAMHARMETMHAGVESAAACLVKENNKLNS